MNKLILVASIIIGLTGCGSSGSSKDSQPENSTAVISGDLSATLVEDNLLDATGTLTVVDPDLNESEFIAISSLNTGYGIFNLTAEGNWDYSLSNSISDIQELTANKTIIDPVTISSLDGTLSNIGLEIQGTNDIPSIEGLPSLEISNQDQTQQSGTLAITDIDLDESNFIAQSNVATNYGDFSLDINGDWTYYLDTENADVKALTSNASLNDNISFSSQDGTNFSFSIKIVTIVKKLQTNELGIDFSDWYLSVPTDEDGNGKSDSIYETDLSKGYTDEYFYVSDDNGLVFTCPNTGYKTSENTKYVRVELREMLRRGDTSISTQGVTLNNWVFASAPESAQQKAGGVDGNLSATLAVNKVTTTGEDYQIGRIIIGQIHANDDEPIRLYYRKLPNNTKGSIYFAHEPIDEDDLYYEMIGSRSNSADDPEDGIALDEKFSYRIQTVGNDLTVTISRDHKDDVTKTINMSTSGYDDSNQYMYFKAGVYNQNNSGDDDDWVRATFYQIKNSHDGYAFSEE